jgi:hypothetical protein
MNTMQKRISCLKAISLIFSINTTYTMDVPPQKVQPDQKLLLSAIQAKIPHVGIKKRLFERSCDKFYGNKKYDSHEYLEFSPNGRHLIEVREQNIARFVITDMETRQSSCFPVPDSARVVVTSNNHSAIVAYSQFGFGSTNLNCLFKIDLAQGALIKNFSQQIAHLHKQGYMYKQLVYNPCKATFISVSEGSDRFFCLHDSITGVVKSYWREKEEWGVGDNEISYSPNGRYCLISYEDHTDMIDAETGEQLWKISTPINNTIWHPKNSFFITSLKDEDSFISAECGEKVHKIRFRLDDATIERSFFTANGNYFISLVKCYNPTIDRHDIAIIIQDGKTYEVVNSIRGIFIYDEDKVCLSSDGKYLAYVMYDYDAGLMDVGCSSILRCQEERFFGKYLVLYDLEQCTEAARLPLKKEIQDLKFRPHTHQLLVTEVSYYSTKLMVWDVVSNKVIKETVNDLESADDWHIELVADVYNGETDADEIDEETYATLPKSVQMLLDHVKNEKL